MQTLRRLLIWLAEVVFEALLLGSFLALFFGYDPQSPGKDVLILGVCIFWMFFLTGYLLTTALSRALWKFSGLWSYSVLAVALFLIHFEILSVGIGGAYDPSDRLRIRVAGIFIVFACTLAGSLAVRFWAAPVPRLKSAEDCEREVSASL